MHGGVLHACTVYVSQQYTGAVTVFSDDADPLVAAGVKRILTTRWLWCEVEPVHSVAEPATQSLLGQKIVLVKPPTE